MRDPDVPRTYLLAGGVPVRMFPRGEIAEFLFYHPGFESDEMRLFVSVLRPGMRVVDAGANIGVYSILADRRVGPTGRVWAFEPAKATFLRLLDNLLLNDCSSVVTVQAALADRDGVVLPLCTDRGFGDAYRYLADNPPVRHVSQEPVNVVSLDSYLATVGVGEVDAIKMDIEGGEYRALRGATRILQDSTKVLILFESDPYWPRRAGYSQDDALRFLRELGFGLYCWNARTKQWSSSEGALRRAETVWASRDPALLPAL